MSKKNDGQYKDCRLAAKRSELRENKTGYLFLEMGEEALPPAALRRKMNKVLY